MSVEGPISINVAQVLADRLGRKARWLPGFLVRALERLICQQEMNELLAGAYPRRGAAFCEYVLEHLGVELEVRGAENLPSSGRCIVAGNHPLGGLDGVSMLAWLSRQYSASARFVVNDLLMAVDPLSESFIPINKHGSQSRAASATLDDALAGDDPVVIYPAGLVSRLGKGGVVADLEWRKMFVNKAVESHRDIVPVFFDGFNSPSFYRLARLRKRIHLAMALVMTVVIVAFDRFGNDSVINLVFRVAGYTYGPILGLFVFGMACRRRIRERYVPAIAVLSPALSWALQWWTAERYGYHIGSSFWDITHYSLYWGCF